jgi:hypothetical protein
MPARTLSTQIQGVDAPHMNPTAAAQVAAAISVVHLYQHSVLHNNMLNTTTAVGPAAEEQVYPLLCMLFLYCGGAAA